MVCKLIIWTTKPASFVFHISECLLMWIIVCPCLREQVLFIQTLNFGQYCDMFCKKIVLLFKVFVLSWTKNKTYRTCNKLKKPFLA